VKLHGQLGTSLTGPVLGRTETGKK
jgi:hypothetical protein